MPEASQPLTIDVERDRGLTIVWSDGTSRFFGSEELRRHCPCAGCREQRARDLPVWPQPSSPLPLRIIDAEFVGAWGIRLQWNDAHSTGIYSWELLRD